MNAHLSKLRAAPPFTLAAVLLLWGWQTGFILFALPMIVILEMAHWVSWRWPVSDKEFNIISDFSGIGFFIVVVYIFTTVGSRGIFVILSVMPFILFLLLLVQFYSERGKIGLSSIFVSLRRLDPRTTPEASTEVDLSLPYLVVCIISASSGNIRSVWFFIFSFCLIAIVLWSFRPKRYRIRTWSLLLIVVLTMSYAGQEALRDLQRSFEASIISMFDQFMWRYRDAERAMTAIGTIGRLKLSDRIVLRVKPQTYLDKPLYLREASYHQYNYGVWNNLKSIYTVIDPDLDGNWHLADAEQGDAVSISAYMQREISVIPLPHGTISIEDTDAFEVNQSQYGTVKMEFREGWIDYSAVYRDNIIDSLPQPTDLDIAENYREDFEQLARELDLYDQPEEQAVTSIEKFFRDNFTYSLTQRGRYPRGKYLQNFLFNTRTGHCEYFATSTVLLLRTLGIPARYAVGYVVDEYSPIERQYVARSRDAHSWVLAYIGNQWRIIDTTPSIWSPLEDENASMLEPIMDIYAWISFRLSQFQSRDEFEQEEDDNSLLYLLIPLVLILLWRLFFHQRRRPKRDKTEIAIQNSYQGTDSSFYDLVKELNRIGFMRKQGETMGSWLKRINESVRLSELDKALALHYRYRFDPAGCTISIKEELAATVKHILTNGIFSIAVHDSH